MVSCSINYSDSEGGLGNGDRPGDIFFFYMAYCDRIAAFFGGGIVVAMSVVTVGFWMITFLWTGDFRALQQDYADEVVQQEERTG